MNAKIRKTFPFLLLVGSLLVFLLFCLIAIFILSSSRYNEIKKPPPPFEGSFIGKAYGFDPRLGVVLSRGESGMWLLAGGDSIPFHHDKDGFGRPSDKEHVVHDKKGPRLLFLGDSFTYGQFVKADEVFPYKVGQYLEGEAINGGVPGYGLAQMVLSARKLVPRYKPDYVIVQYSSWLAERSLSEFAQNSHKTVMTPYFHDENNGSVAIAFPPFIPDEELLARMDYFKQSPASLQDRIQFFIQCALPFSIRHYPNYAAFRIRQLFGLAPKPTKHSDLAIRSAYAEIDALARQHGARTIVLVLGNHFEFSVPEHLFPPGIAGVQAWHEMASRLEPATPIEFIRQYYHWRGNPPEPVDTHPNEQAHAIIAELVAQRIRELESPK